ncbi:MAG: hypothetical protein BWY84_00713 [Candidatus Aerophobetes bacterium ADurb.Bin490]|nr:MAG: hypothetical protein BWY84_00713 [Candidatus Aerophobetes bacterium ADurb.Bin490]
MRCTAIETMSRAFFSAVSFVSSSRRFNIKSDSCFAASIMERISSCLADSADSPEMFSSFLRWSAITVSSSWSRVDNFFSRSFRDFSLVERSFSFLSIISIFLSRFSSLWRTFFSTLAISALVSRVFASKSAWAFKMVSLDSSSASFLIEPASFCAPSIIWAAYFFALVIWPSAKILRPKKPAATPTIRASIATIKYSISFKPPPLMSNVCFNPQ